MGYFYTAYCARNNDWKDNAEMLFKIGETCQAIEKRIEQILPSLSIKLTEQESRFLNLEEDL